MSPAEFDDFFARGQQWLATHGQVQHEGSVDITRTYVRQQIKIEVRGDAVKVWKPK